MLGIPRICWIYVGNVENIEKYVGNVRNSQDMLDICGK
tara:strand:- start:96 stop:209 length:114 start_codon:yes stop_codon:yes gene_type:complete